jgi:hypothetical protein
MSGTLVPGQVFDSPTHSFPDATCVRTLLQTRAVPFGANYPLAAIHQPLFFNFPRPLETTPSSARS